MILLSFKQVESNYGKKEPCERGGLLSFLIVLIWDTVNMLLFFFEFELKIGCICCTHEEKNL